MAKVPKTLTGLLGQNVVATVEGDELTLKIDLSQKFGLTKAESGHVIGSTRGSTVLPFITDRIVRVGLNVVESIPANERTRKVD